MEESHLRNLPFDRDTKSLWKLAVSDGQYLDTIVCFCISILFRLPVSPIEIVSATQRNRINRRLLDSMPAHRQKHLLSWIENIKRFY